MRHDNPDLQIGDGTGSVPAFGRALIQTVTVTSAVSEVILLTPDSPYKRFQIEVDNWASVDNQKRGIIKFGVNGATRDGAADYSWYVNANQANTGEGHDRDESDSKIGVTRDDNEWAFGDGTDENFCFNFDLYPGEGSSAIKHPRIWWSGNGTTDETSRGIMYNGFGIYRGKSSNEYGRIEWIEFTLSDSSNIRSGEFRLYGTE